MAVRNMSKDYVRRRTNGARYNSHTLLPTINALDKVVLRPYVVNGAAIRCKSPEVRLCSDRK